MVYQAIALVGLVSVSLASSLASAAGTTVGVKVQGKLGVAYEPTVGELAICSSTLSPHILYLNWKDRDEKIEYQVENAFSAERVAGHEAIRIELDQAVYYMEKEIAKKASHRVFYVSPNEPKTIVHKDFRGGQFRKVKITFSYLPEGVFADKPCVD